jgi:hypothetical protein
MATLSTIIKQSKDPGKLLVYVMYGHGGKSCLIGTGIVINSRQWDAENKALTINDYDEALKGIKQEVINEASKLLSLGINPHPRLVKEKFIKGSLKVSDLEKQLVYHLEQVQRLKGELKRAKRKEKFDNGYNEVIKESMGYAKKRLEKMAKVPVSDISLINAQQVNLKLKRNLNSLNIKIKGV